MGDFAPIAKKLEVVRNEPPGGQKLTFWSEELGSESMKISSQRLVTGSIMTARCIKCWNKLHKPFNKSR